jgi:uncharacterized protein YlxP (DUF503 family)
MTVIAGRFHLMLPGCASLKEKRHRLSSLKALALKREVLVMETDFQEDHQQAELVFLSGSASRSIAQKIMQQLEAELDAKLDGICLDTEIEEIPLF